MRALKGVGAFTDEEDKLLAAYVECHGGKGLKGCINWGGVVEALKGKRNTMECQNRHHTLKRLSGKLDREEKEEKGVAPIPLGLPLSLPFPLSYPSKLDAHTLDLELQHFGASLPISEEVIDNIEREINEERQRHQQGERQGERERQTQGQEHDMDQKEGGRLHINTKLETMMDVGAGLCINIDVEEGIEGEEGGGGIQGREGREVERGGHDIHHRSLLPLSPFSRLDSLSSRCFEERENSTSNPSSSSSSSKGELSSSPESV